MLSLYGFSAWENPNARQCSAEWVAAVSESRSKSLNLSRRWSHRANLNSCVSPLPTFILLGWTRLQCLSAKRAGVQKINEKIFPCPVVTL